MQPLQRLKIVLFSQLLLEAIEGIKTERQLKFYLNKAVNELENIVNKDYANIYNIDPEMCTNIMREMEDLITKISKMQVDEIVLLNAVHDKYLQNKEWFTEHGNAEFLRLE